MQNYLLSIKAPYSYLLQIISYNMPSGIVTKLYNNYHYQFFFLPNKLFLGSSKAAHIKEIILCIENSRPNIIQNLYTFQARINELQTTPRICLQEHITPSNEKIPGEKRLDQINRDPFSKKKVEVNC